MTTNEIEIALMYYFNKNSNKTMLNNVTNMHPCITFETDMLLLSANNYATGFEIKISKNDLKNDLKKPQYTGLKTKYTQRSISDYYKYFKHFNYAVPEHLIEHTLEIAHPFCGIYSVFYKNNYSIPQIEEIRKPSIINKCKWSDKDVAEIHRLATFRIYGLMLKNLKLKNKLKKNQN